MVRRSQVLIGGLAAGGSLKSCLLRAGSPPSVGPRARPPQAGMSVLRMPLRPPPGGCFVRRFLLVVPQLHLWRRDGGLA